MRNYGKFHASQLQFLKATKEQALEEIKLAAQNANSSAVGARLSQVAAMLQADIADISATLSAK